MNNESPNSVARPRSRGVKYTITALNILLLYHVYLFIYPLEQGIISTERFIGLAILNCGLGLLLYACYVDRRHIRNLGKNWSKILILIIALGLVSVIRSFEFDYIQLTWLFGYPLAGGAWLVPAVAVVGAQKSFWNAVSRTYNFQISAGIIIQVISLSTYIYMERNFRVIDPAVLAYISPLFLLRWPYLGLKSVLISLFSILTMGFVSAIYLMRSYVLLSMVYLASFGKLFLSRTESGNRRIVFFSIAALITLFICFLYIGYDLGDFVAAEIDAFMDKLPADTRTLGFVEFFETLSIRDIIIGRGALGSYLSYYLRILEPIGRFNIESGYLQIILKNGILMLIPFVAITFTACYRGIFHSKNSLCRAAGLLILARLTLMPIHFTPSLDPTYVLFWLAVGGCLSKEVLDSCDDKAGLLK